MQKAKPEYDVSTDRSKPISKFIKGVSRWKLIIDAARTTAIVFYGFKDDPKFISPNGSGQLTLIVDVLLNRGTK